MKILTFTLKYSETRWPEYLENFLGKELAEKCSVESHATAKTHIAKVNILNFNGSKQIINKIKNNKDVESAYIAENRGSVEVLLNRD